MTWISVLASSTTLEAPMRKVSCTEPGLMAVESPLQPQPQPQPQPPSQRPLRPVPAPLQAAQTLRLPPPPQTLPNPVVRITLLPLVLMSLPLLPLEFSLRVCLRWVTSVDWLRLLGPLSDGTAGGRGGLMDTSSWTVFVTVSGFDRRLLVE